MRKTVEIDGRPVEFLSTASVPRLYRIKFKRDIFVDMQKIATEINEARKVQEDRRTDESTIPVEALTLFEDVAYIMAKHADKDAVPDSPDEWLDQFDVFSIYQVFPVIEELWTENLRQLNQTQKK